MMINLPIALLLAMQQPLNTKWWTIGPALATLASKYLPSLKQNGKSVRSMTNTSSNEENTVASNLL
jgi:hypothetical protein